MQGRVALRWGLVLILGGCAPEETVELPFKGARHIELKCAQTRTAANQEEIAVLVEALLEVYGGLEELRELSFQTKEDLYVRRSGDVMSNHADKRVFFRPDNMVRVETEFRSGLEQLLLYQGQAYLAARGLEPTPATGAGEQAVFWDQKVFSLPVLLASAGVQLRGKEPAIFEGRLLIPIDVELAPPPLLTIWVDPWGPVIRRVEATLPLAGNLATHKVEVRQELIYSDFRRVEGFLVPFRASAVADGRRVGLSEMVEFTPNPDLPDSIFVP